MILWQYSPGVTLLHHHLDVQMFQEREAMCAATQGVKKAKIKFLVKEFGLNIDTGTLADEKEKESPKAS